MAKSTFPSAITPIYSTSEPNQPITLYEGPIEITQGALAEQGNGNISFLWLPFPYIKFVLSISNFSFKIKLDDPSKDITSLLLSDIGTSVKVSLTSITYDHNAPKPSLRITGQPIEPIQIGNGGNLAYILFHIPNFQEYQGKGISSKGNLWAGRTEFGTNEWSVTIDSILVLSEMKKSLESVGGYAITHVGKLQRTDGTLFNSSDSISLLEALQYFLSFARGFSTSPMLFVGFDGNGNQIWQEWVLWKSDNWQHADSWFTEDYPESLSNMFPGFWTLWQDSVWNDLTRLTIDWYIQSNIAQPDRAIVLIQTTLELLSWIILVEEGQVLTERGYDSLWASDRLRLLFSRTQIPLTLNSGQRNLIKLSQTEKWLDAPHALTEIRNRLVHPKIDRPKTGSTGKKGKTAKPRNVLAYPLAARHEAAQLGLWYVERVLMHLFNYNGHHNDHRLIKHLIT